MKKLLFLFIFISLVSCSTTGRVGTVNGLGPTIEDSNNMAGKTVTRVNGRTKPDEIYYIPFYSHNW